MDHASRNWITHRATRRSLLGSVGLSGLCLSLASGSSLQAQRGSPSSTPEVVSNGLQLDGSWAFTDDRGVQTILDQMPSRIAAGVFAAAPLWDFGVRPVGIFGWNINADGTLTEAGGSIDETRVEILNGEPNLLDPERAVAVGADLVVTVTFSPDEPDNLWGMTPEAVPLVERVAPIIAISGIERADLIAERFGRLAEALGSDLQSSSVQGQSAAYDDAATNFQALTSAHPEITAIFAFPEPDQVYLANPIEAADTQLFSHLGLRVLPADSKPGEGWIPVSYEEIGLYASDLFFYAAGEGALTETEILAHPTLSRHPAVAAGNLAPWRQDVVFSYAGLAEILTGVSQAIADLVEERNGTRPTREGPFRT